MSFIVKASIVREVLESRMRVRKEGEHSEGRRVGGKGEKGSGYRKRFALVSNLQMELQDRRDPSRVLQDEGDTRREGVE